MFTDYVYCILGAVVLANCLVKSTSQIYWHLADPPVTFGADVQLVCNTTCCIHDSEEAFTSWAVFNEDFSSLSRNLISRNFSKYEIFTSRHECRLTIKNFEPNDINKTYTCYSQFQQYSKILTLNPDNFEQQPSANSILTWTNVTENELQVSFLITNVYPEPRCFAYYKEINITSKMKIKSKKDGMMYNTKIDISYRLLPGEFNVICAIGTKILQLPQIQFYGIHDGFVKTKLTIRYTKKGADVTLECLAPEGPSVTWRYNQQIYSIGKRVNEAIPNHDKISIVGRYNTSEYNIRITNFGENDEGIYWCVSGAGDMIFDVKFDVRIMQAPYDLEILNQTQNIVYAKEGEQTLLTCRVKKGIPPETLLWYSNGIVLVNGSGQVKYDFIPSDADDLHVFICRAKHPALDEDLEESVQLILSKAPDATLAVEPSEPIYKGRNIVLICDVKNPLGVTSIVWMKNTSRLNYRSFTISLTNLSSSDSGNYTCTVENEFGSTSSSFLLNVQDYIVLQEMTTGYLQEYVSLTGTTLTKYIVFYILSAFLVVIVLTCSLVTWYKKCRRQVLSVNQIPSSNQVNFTNDRMSGTPEADYEEIMEDAMILHEQENVTQQSSVDADRMQRLKTEMESSSSKSGNSSIEPIEGTDGYLNPYVSIIDESKDFHCYDKCTSQNDNEETFEKIKIL